MFRFFCIFDQLSVCGWLGVDCKTIKGVSQKVSFPICSANTSDADIFRRKGFFYHPGLAMSAMCVWKHHGCRRYKTTVVTFNTEALAVLDSNYLTAAVNQLFQYLACRLHITEVVLYYRRRPPITLGVLAFFDYPPPHCEFGWDFPSPPYSILHEILNSFKIVTFY